MQRELTPKERKDSLKTLPSPEAKCKEVKSKYEFKKVEAETQSYFESNRFINRDYDGKKFQFAQFTATYEENGVLTISASHFEQVLQHNRNITHALWINSLNQLITVAVADVAEIKVWVYENAQFICKLTLTDDSYIYRGRFFSDVQISDDNQLIVAKLEQSNFCVFFHLLNKKVMSTTVGKAIFCMPAVISSSQIALCDLVSIDEVTVFDINFDKKTCEKNGSLKLPIERGKYLADYHFLSKNDIIYAFGKPVMVSCIGRIFHGIQIRIYHRNTNTFSELYKSGNKFVKLDLSTDKTQILLYGDQQFQLINLEKKEQLGQKLADALPIFSMDLVKIITNYALYNNDPRPPDARTLTRLPFEIQLKFQVCLLNLISQDDTLVKLYFLIANHPRKSLKECVALAKKQCSLSRPKRWWHYSKLFAEIRKISTAEARESKDLLSSISQGKRT